MKPGPTPNKHQQLAAGKLPTCRFCTTELKQTVVDLGMSPLCQTQIAPDQLNDMEAFFPLHVYVCGNCYLVQLEEFARPDLIFNAQYPYFSSYSDSWLAHAKQYVEHVREDFKIDGHSFVVEVASNDGYLLQHFVKAGVPCLGIEPVEGVAEAARARGVRTITKFFGEATAKEVRAAEGPAQLILGNNVIAHVPDLNDFVEGVRVLLDTDGFATFEFHHLMQLVELNQFDTIYHEHFCYFLFTTIRQVFAAHKLRLFDVKELGTHGGSLRIYACHAASKAHVERPSVNELENREIAKGYRTPERYFAFAKQVEQIKRRLLSFLLAAKDQDKQVVGYGAPGKGNTLLNYCGIRRDFLDYTVDRNPHRQGTYTPGTHIPIYDPSRIFETRPDYVLILPWNLTKEITTSMAGIKAWGGKFVVPIPTVRVLD